MESPILKTLDKGTHYICMCGLSSKHPLCYGSHKATQNKPMPITLDDAKVIAICSCKKSSNFPYCDGSHNKIKPQE